jgi:hypothetical protein
VLIFPDYGTDIPIERTKAPHNAPIATKPIFNIAKNFPSALTGPANCLVTAVDPLPRWVTLLGTFSALWHCFPRQRLTIDPPFRCIPAHIDEANSASWDAHTAQLDWTITSCRLSARVRTNGERCSWNGLRYSQRRWASRRTNGPVCLSERDHC